MSIRTQLFKHFVYMPAVMVQAGRMGPVLNSLKTSESWNPKQLASQQDKRLLELLAHARNHVEAYRDQIPDLDRSGITARKTLAELTPVTKQQIQLKTAAFRSNAPTGRSIVKTTGGSTGVPVTIHKTRTSMIHELAAAWRGYNWAGIEIGDPQARFWGVPRTTKGRILAQITDFTCHRQRCSAFAFEDQDLHRFLDSMGRFRPKWLYGYVSMLEAFADFIDRTGAVLPAGLKAIVSTSELLTDSIREHLESTFGVSVFNEYGCGEIGTIAHECPEGRLHLNDENMIVEILDGDRPCAPGEPGEIVVTELHNHAQPLIRYRMGDHGLIAVDRCLCGRGLTVLDSVLGRAYDFIVNSAGRRFHGEYMIYLFEQLQEADAGVTQFQVEQIGIGNFTVRIVINSHTGTTTYDAIRRTIQSEIEPDAQVEIVAVDRIPREASGKLRVIKGMSRR